MDDWPGNWGRDKGIDLIARKYDGQIVAIQAKHCGRVAAGRNRCEALARRHRPGRLKVYRDHPQQRRSCDRVRGKRLFTRPSSGLLDVEIVRTLLHGAGSGLQLG